MAKRVVAGDGGEAAFLAFDRFSEPSRAPLMPIPEPLRGKLPAMKARTKGLSDLRSNVDSPEAAEVKKLLSTLKREEYKPVIEEISLAGNYSHGTHVAGIAMEGNPQARLVNLRYFAGLTIEQSAKALGISRVTAHRYWTFARAWLHQQMTGEPG